MFKKIYVIGSGMMGSSLIHTIRKKKIAEEVKAIVQNSTDIAKLEHKNIIASTDYNELKQADLIVICANLGAYEEVVAKLNQIELPKTLITEIGSVKTYPENLFKDKYKYPDNFVASHPIAGSDKSGTGIIVPDLYEQKQVFITSKKNANTEKIAHFWQEVGMSVLYMSALKHDKIFAETSHFPQLLAFEIKEQLGPNQLWSLRKNENNPLAATLRLCNSNELMWQEIFTNNATELEKIKTRFEVKAKLNDFSDFARLQNKFLKYRKEYDSEQFLEEEFIIQLVYYYLQVVETDLYEEYLGEGFKDFIQYFLHFA